MKRSKEIFASLASLDTKVSALDGGTNIYSAKFPAGVDGQKLIKELSDRFIRISRINNNETLLTVNETLLYREPNYIVNSFGEAIKRAR